MREFLNKIQRHPARTLFTLGLLVLMFRWHGIGFIIIPFVIYLVWESAE